jgi:Putative zinc-finger
MTPMNELHDALHRQVWDLIPWVAASSASDADDQRVQQHLANCDHCREEMAFHQDLVLGMRSHHTPPLAQDGDDTADSALQRLWARVDHSAQPAAASAPGLATATATATTSAITSASAKPVSTQTRWLMAAVLVQAVGLAALAGLLLNNNRGDHDAAYRTLSTATTAPRVVHLRLVPATSMPVGQLSSLLMRHGLQIVESNHDGSVLGLAAAVTITPAELQALATQLRAEPGVMLAEPTATGLGR